MKTINLELFGGRINCVKFALNLAIDLFENNNQKDMGIIYKDILKEITDQEQISVEVKKSKD